jgi:hypothetical protein
VPDKGHAASHYTPFAASAINIGTQFTDFSLDGHQGVSHENLRARLQRCDSLNFTQNRLD